MTADPRLLETAVEAARRGGEVLLERYHRTREVDTKTNDADLVTDADRASEAVVAGLIRARHPDHALLAEEGTRGGPEGRYRWVVDPLDGTVNYAYRIPHWCVSVAVEDDAGPVVGVIFDPLRDELFVAARGGGATLNGAPLAVRDTDRLSDALLVTGFAYDRGDRARNVPVFSRFAVECRGIRRLGSAALDLAYVAAGRLHGYWELGLKRWDVAAGLLLVAEAGGLATGFEDGERPLDTGRVVAAGPGLHPRMREVIADIFV